jgi:hypothetical protein
MMTDVHLQKQRSLDRTPDVAPWAYPLIISGTRASAAETFAAVDPSVGRATVRQAAHPDVDGTVVAAARP